jgi:hypothetical protein
MSRRPLRDAARGAAARPRPPPQGAGATRGCGRRRRQRGQRGRRSPRRACRACRARRPLSLSAWPATRLHPAQLHPTPSRSSAAAWPPGWVGLVVSSQQSGSGLGPGSGLGSGSGSGSGLEPGLGGSSRHSWAACSSALRRAASPSAAPPPSAARSRKSARAAARLARRRCACLGPGPAPGHDSGQGRG